MPAFDERYGFKPAREALQVDGLEQRTRSRLWNVAGWAHSPSRATLSLLDRVLLDRFFGLPDTDWPRDQNGVCKMVAEVYKAKPLWEVFKLLELVLGHLPEHKVNSMPGIGRQVAGSVFRLAINKVLEEEGVGWRVCGDLVVPIVEDEQLQAIDAARGEETVALGAREHLGKALACLRTADGKTPADSVEESILAVEAAARDISGDGNATLVEALKIIGNRRKLHSQLKTALENLYHYTSDEKGIRHSLLHAPANVTQADAIFMVVTGSAYVSWLYAHKQPNRPF